MNKYTETLNDIVENNMINQCILFGIVIMLGLILKYLM